MEENSIEIKTKKESFYLPQIEIIRAVASLAVAIYHLGGKTVPVLDHGWLGVEMFFTLSGFIICWSIPLHYKFQKDAWIFLSKRLVRIEPPYLISIILVIIFNYLLINNFTPDWLNIVGHLAYLNNFTNWEYLNPVYWTLGIEFQFYILIAFIFPFLLQRFGMVLILILCFLPSFISFYSGLLLSVFPLFALGIFMWLYKAKIMKLKIFLICVVLVVILGILSLGIKEIIAGLISVIIIAFFNRTNIVVTFFSRISFSLYLTHDVVGSRLVLMLGKILPHTWFFKGIIFCAGLTFSITFAYFFYILIERPFYNFSKKIRYNSGTSLLNSGGNKIYPSQSF